MKFHGFQAKWVLLWSNCQKWVLLWSNYQKYVSQIDQHNFIKYYIILYAQFTSCLHGKSVHKKELSRTKFYGFQAKWASYSHNHDIVCSNNPILCICVHLGMTNNVDLGSFNFRYKKIIFHFLSIKNGFFFVKRLPKLCCKNRKTKF
jgi:hypothetical protein